MDPHPAAPRGAHQTGVRPGPTSAPGAPGEPSAPSAPRLASPPAAPPPLPLLSLAFPPPSPQGHGTPPRSRSARALLYWRHGSAALHPSARNHALLAAGGGRCAPPSSPPSRPSTISPAVGVADRDSLAGAMEFAAAAVARGVQPIVGANLALAEPGRPAATGRVVLFAKNEAGWRNLLALSSCAYLEPASEAAGPSVTLARLKERADGLICLTGGAEGALAPHPSLSARKKRQRSSWRPSSPLSATASTWSSTATAWRKKTSWSRCCASSRAPQGRASGRRQPRPLPRCRLPRGPRGAARRRRRTAPPRRRPPPEQPRLPLPPPGRDGRPLRRPARGLGQHPSQLPAAAPSTRAPPRRACPTSPRLARAKTTA